MSSKVFRFLPVILLLGYITIKITLYVRADIIPAPPHFVPTSAQKMRLIPVQESLQNHPQAAENFSNLFTGLSLVVEADQKILRTTEDVRRTHQNAGALAVQVGEVPHLPGFTEAVNAFLKSEIGTENIPLDTAKRDQIGEAFRALSWAAKQ